MILALGEHFLRMRGQGFDGYVRGRCRLILGSVRRAGNMMAKHKRTYRLCRGRRFACILGGLWGPFSCLVFGRRYLKKTLENSMI